MKAKSECTHEEFYAQFVNDNVKAMVLREFRLEELMNSKDENLNDLPLKRWGRVGVTWDVMNLLKETKGAGYSLSTAVCVNKSAARIIMEENKAK